MTKRIIIDCDPGNGIAGANVDDGLAIALAMASDKLHIELITTVSGNTPRDIGYHVAKEIAAFSHSPIIVKKGANHGLLEPAQPWREHLDHCVEQQGLLKLWSDFPKPSISSSGIPDAAQAIGELVCNNPNEITVIAIGPLTNIAHVISLYPDFVSSVAEIVIMGGVFDMANYLKDTNFAIDPEAAKLVLNSGAHVTLAPLDVTTTTLLTHHDLDQFAKLNRPLTNYLVKTTRPWLNYSITTRHISGCWIHDVLCIAYLIDPSLVTSNQYCVDVALHGDYVRGSSRRWKKGDIRLTVGMPKLPEHTINIFESVNNTKLLELIYQVLAKY